MTVPGCSCVQTSPLDPLHDDVQSYHWGGVVQQSRPSPPGPGRPPSRPGRGPPSAPPRGPRRPCPPPPTWCLLTPARTVRWCLRADRRTCCSPSSSPGSGSEPSLRGSPRPGWPGCSREASLIVFSHYCYKLHIYFDVDPCPCLLHENKDYYFTSSLLLIRHTTSVL